MTANATNATPKKRTTRYTDAEVCAALSATNGMVYLAAKRLGCGPSSIYRRMDKSAKVKSVVDDSRGELLDTAETALKSAVIAKEGWAVCFTLKTIGKERGYVERSEHEHTGKDRGPIQLEAVDYRASIAALAPIADGSMEYSAASGENKTGVLRKTLGENSNGGINSNSSGE